MKKNKPLQAHIKVKLTLTREHFKRSSETYQITFPGHQLYLMTSPEQIAKIYRNTTELTFDTFIRDTLMALGASPSAVDKWIPPRAAMDDLHHSTSVPDQLSSDFTHVGERLCQRQLLPGKELETLQKTFMEGIHDALLWNKVTPKITVQSFPDSRRISLLGWCREVLLEAATRAFFGDRLLHIDPNLFQSFFKFDSSSWKLNYGYPRILSQDMYAARDNIIAALETYFKLPSSERPGTSFLIDSFEKEMRQLDICDKDIAALVMPVYWV